MIEKATEKDFIAIVETWEASVTRGQVAQSRMIG
jgi:hypothetical protein